MVTFKIRKVIRFLLCFTLGHFRFDYIRQKVTLQIKNYKNLYPHNPFVDKNTAMSYNFHQNTLWINLDKKCVLKIDVYLVMIMKLGFQNSQKGNIGAFLRAQCLVSQEPPRYSPSFALSITITAEYAALTSNMQKKQAINYDIHSPILK